MSFSSISKVLDPDCELLSDTLIVSLLGLGDVQHIQEFILLLKMHN